MITDWTDLELPAAVQTELKRALLDTVGVGLGARQLPATRIMARHVRRQYASAGSQAAAFIWATGQPTTFLGACLANGIAVDALDMHDSAHNAKGHAGAALVPCALALAGEADRSGRAALRLLALGYEVAYRAGESLIASAPEYHSSGAWNALGCAAMASAWLGLSPEQAHHALGIAEYYGPRSLVMGCMRHPAMVKDGSGWGSFVGANAALLAQEGFTSCPPQTVHAAPRPELWADLGQRWHLLEYHVYKKFPTCYWAQAAIAAALELRPRIARPDDIQAIEIRTFPEAARLFGGIPQTTDQAQYSLGYAVVRALVDGTVDNRSVTALDDIEDRVRRLVACCTVRIHDRYAQQDLHGTRFHDNAAQLSLRIAGQSQPLESRLCHVPWDTFRGQAAPTWAELESKFLTLGVNTGLDRGRLLALAQLISKLETLASLRPLLVLLQGLSDER